MTNGERIAGATAAVGAYVEAGRGDPADLETTVTDLLADLMHYVDQYDMDFTTCLGRAERHHQAEKEEA